MRKFLIFGLTHFYNMIKRKQNASSELRTSPINLSVHRYSDLTSLRLGMKIHWGIEHSQPFFPPIEKLFKTYELDSPSEYGIRFQEEIVNVVNSNSIKLSTGNVKDIHKKVSMILSPYKWMQGDYGGNVGLSVTSEQSSVLQEKLQNPNNYAYVGSILSILLSQSECPHFPKVYGVFSGISDRHVIDISDDYGELSERSWFTQNIGKTFEISLSENVQSSSDFNHTRSARVSLQLGEEIHLDNVFELETTHVEAGMADIDKVFHNEEEEDDDAESDSSSVSTSYIFDVCSCKCEEEEEYEDIDDDDDEEPFAWASFSNVPVQVTIMEKCSGTLYELLMTHQETEKHLAWITQVIFALAFAQRNFAFTHNDLHANNVMFVPYDKEYLYYNCAGVIYRVPTYGYLIKLIDFERSIGMVKLNGFMKHPRLFMSDHFAVNEEAGGQYNYEDFYVPKYPEIKPNPSFDLVRLATSLFWDLFPEGPNHTEYSENPIFKMFMRWLTLEDGNSILFSKKDARHDRYHGFHLYKAIARFCKDNAVPRKEILGLKSIYGVDSVETGYSVLSICNP